MKEHVALLTWDEPVKWLFAGDGISHGAIDVIGLRNLTERIFEVIED